VQWYFFQNLSDRVGVWIMQTFSSTCRATTRSLLEGWLCDDVPRVSKRCHTKTQLEVPQNPILIEPLEQYASAVVHCRHVRCRQHREVNVGNNTSSDIFPRWTHVLDEASGKKMPRASVARCSFVSCQQQAERERCSEVQSNASLILFLLDTIYLVGLCYFGC